MEQRKGFKGKGGLRRELNAIDTELQRVHQEMSALVQQTRAMPNRVFALQVYRRTGAQGTRVWSVRWRLDRLRIERQGRHATWATIKPLLQNLDPATAAWYEQINTRADAANRREKQIRAKARAAKAELR